nr:hypothetical protein T20F7.4 - Caenorhabditis elegans [Caenorhabditis elegans]
MRNNDDVGDPDHVRGSGPLILEPRGYWYPTDDEMELLERRHLEKEAQTTTNKGSNNIDYLSSKIERQLETVKKEDKKNSNSVDSCRSESSLPNHNQNSDDDDEQDGIGRSGFSSSCSKYQHSVASSSAGDNSQTTSSSCSQPPSSKQRQRPVRDTTLKNRRRREKCLLRAQKREEEKITVEIKRFKDEKRLEKLKQAEERKNGRKVQKMQLMHRKQLRRKIFEKRMNVGF